MTIELGSNNYGKSDIRVMKVTHGPDVHVLRDLTVDVALWGDFDAAHTDGANDGLLATDTMRNTVYALAKLHPIDSIESFADHLVNHFLAAGPSVTRVRVHVVEHPWERLVLEGRPHPHAFQRGHGGDHVATVTGDGRHNRISAGIEDLVVLRTTGSGWEGYLRERYTTLPETDDRILSTAISARWSYADADTDYETGWRAIRQVILDTFADHYSPSVQFTLNRIGRAVLERHPEVSEIRLSLPNKHHLLYDLGRFGLENDNEVFHVTTEPYGLIEGTVVRRDDPPRAAVNGDLTLAGRAAG